MHRALRLDKEIKKLTAEPLTNISISSGQDDLVQDENKNIKLKAQIIGTNGSLYENGIFDLEIVVPERYPFMPPSVHFLTPIYHPNIDKSGRICMDLLTNQTEWTPKYNLAFILISIQCLIMNPNANDPLQPELAFIYKTNYDLFKRNAIEHTN